MELKDFVKNAILDIVNGVKEAQEEDTSGAMIVTPQYRPFGQNEAVRFDIAIEDISKDSSGGKIGVSAGGLLKGNIGGENATGKTESSRIQFEIHICFPCSKQSAKPR